MPDMLNTAVSGLLTFQRALSTISHNIANVNTEGYSRQSVEIRTNTPSFYGNTFYGNGVRVDSVSRAASACNKCSLRCHRTRTRK